MTVLAHLDANFILRGMAGITHDQPLRLFTPFLLQCMIFVRVMKICPIWATRWSDVEMCGEK